MSDLNKQLRAEMHAAFYEYTDTDGSELPHYDDAQWTDFAAGFNAARRAPAAAPAPVAASEGWKEAAIAWEVCASIHREYAKGKDALFKTRQTDFVRHAANARAALAAVPAAAPVVQPVLWYEAEESARGKDVAYVIKHSFVYSTRIHREKPETGNPVWPLYAGPSSTAEAKDAARLDWLNENFFSDEKDEWDERLAPDSIKWKFFGPMSVQGDVRRVIDAAIASSADEVKP